MADVELNDASLQTPAVVPPLPISGSMEASMSTAGLGQGDNEVTAKQSTLSLNEFLATRKISDHSQMQRNITLRINRQMDSLTKLVSVGFKKMRQKLGNLREQLTSMKKRAAHTGEAEDVLSKMRKAVDPSKSIDGFESLFDRYVTRLVFETCVMKVSMKIITNTESVESYLKK